MPRLCSNKCVWLALAGVTGCGCAGLARRGASLTPSDALSLSLPTQIEIVDPFTRITSLTGGDAPDGIEVLVQAVGALDNPGQLLVGRVRIELFEFVPGSATKAGKRLEQWQVDLNTDRQQRTHWNRLTQMYEFRLGVDLTAIPKSDSYLLRVTFTSPLGQRLDDEIVLSQETRFRAGSVSAARRS